MPKPSTGASGAVLQAKPKLKSAVQGNHQKVVVVSYIPLLISAFSLVVIFSPPYFSAFVIDLFSCRT